MLPLEIVEEIDAPLLAIWDQLTRVSQWPSWGPSVTDVRCADECIRLGSVGQVRTAMGFWVNFEITELEPGRFWRWRVAGVEATGHRVEPAGPGRCRLVFEVPWWAAPYALVCRRAARRIAQICATCPPSKPD